MTVWLNLGLCMGVVYTVFCRAAKANAATDPQIRRAFILLGSSAYLYGILPFVHPDQIVLGGLALLVSIIYLQYVTGKFWNSGEAQNRFRRR